MSEQVAALIDQRRADIVRDLAERLDRVLAESTALPVGVTADILIAECAHVVADLPLVVRDGPPAVADHDHDREMPVLRSLGDGLLDGQWPAQVVFRAHVLLRSRLMAHVLGNLPSELPPQQTQRIRARLYDAMDELLGSSPCDFVLAVEKRLRAQRDELAWLARKTLVAQEDERHRIAMDVHDVLSPAVSAALFRVRAALASMDGAGGRAAAELEAAEEALERCLADMRQVELDLRPPVLDAYGLAAAVREHAIRVERQYGLRVSLADGVYERIRLSPDKEAALFRIAQEAMTNAARHAEATELRVRIRADEETVGLEIADNGVGFDVSQELARVVQEQHLGLLGMRERAQLLEGELEIASRRGHGTTISVRVPRPAAEV